MFKKPDWIIIAWSNYSNFIFPERGEEGYGIPKHIMGSSYKNIYWRFSKKKITKFSQIKLILI